MGTGAALDVLLVADKPLSRSPVRMDAARRVAVGITVYCSSEYKSSRIL